nr:endonuclease/exonuclease/phosphatase family protein [Gaetbulibacter sp. 4G1]
MLVIWLGRSFKIHFSEDIKETDLEVVFWNASHNRDFDDAFNINNSIPDVLVLVEDGAYNIENYKLKYPKYYFYESIRGISIFSKTPLKIIDEITSKYKTNIINFEVEGISFYAVDVSASIDVPRSWELGFVNEYIKIKEKTVLLGDFNVPFESKFLTNIKANFNHAFNKKGNGFRETWFWNIPLLSLDHIWISKDLKILKAEKVNTWKSDHSMVKVFITN